MQQLGALHVHCTVCMHTPCAHYILHAQCALHTLFYEIISQKIFDFTNDGFPNVNDVIRRSAAVTVHLHNNIGNIYQSCKFLFQIS